MGIGGEYPVSATVTSESNTSHKSRAVTKVFACQGLGMLLSPSVVLVMLVGGVPLERVWRIALAVGALPSAAVFYFRWVTRTHGTPRGRFRIEDSAEFVSARKEAIELSQMGRRDTPRGGRSPASQGGSSQHTYARVPAEPSFLSADTGGGGSLYRVAPHAMTLVGTALSWFIIDVTLYGAGSFKTLINEALRGREHLDDLTRLRKDASFALMVAAIAFPGYILSILFIEKTGKRALQLGGFVAVALCFLFLGVEQLLGGAVFWLEVILFSATFLFSNFGPNVTTFVLPTEVFPPLVRATCHGISAASGKVGGALGAAAFAPLRRAVGVGWLLLACGFTAAAGAVATWFLTFDTPPPHAVAPPSVDVPTRSPSLVSETEPLAENDHPTDRYPLLPGSRTGT
eukprot:Polyplicarium_translucidae@DN3225_c0_g1_i5.p1